MTPPAGISAIAETRGILVNPEDRPDWDSALEVFSDRTVFHGKDWSRVLSRTYGHNAAYVVQFEGDQLVGVLPIMEVNNLLTGLRGVSLPFTDRCGPLATRGKAALFEAAVKLGRERRWKYFECRDHDGSWPGATASLEFYEHVIDLQPGVDRLFKALESSMRRGVRKALDSGLQVEFRTDPAAMRAFYRLHCHTRKRHGLPPQPFRFFQNIQQNLLERREGFIVAVSRDRQPLAAGVFFIHNHHAIYKFGASDFRSQQFRPNNLMMWSGIQKCAELGARILSLGRTSLSNDGLRRFKNSLGAAEQLIHYARYDFNANRFSKEKDKAEGWHNRLFALLPLPLLRLAGEVLYPALS